ncbi:MAG: AMP-binding protein [Thermoanaerobaculia bacterium]
MSPRPGDPILEAFARLVRRRPDAPLLLAADGAVTAAGIDALGRRVEARLAATDLPPERPIGLRGPNGTAFLTGFLGARRAGHPVVLLDQRATAPELARQAERFGLGALLQVPAEGGDLPTMEPLGGAEREPPPAGTAAVKLTSGSSGESRGVAVSAGALCADDSALRASMGIAEGDRLLALVPFAHSYGLSSLLVPALTVGLTLVVPEDRGPFGALRAAREHEVTVFPTVPAYLAALLSLGEGDVLPPSLRLVLSAGSALPPAVAERFRRRFGLPVHAFYGASECGGIAYDREGRGAERGTVGEPVDGVSVELEEVPGLSAQEGGRVVVRSAAVAPGYWPEPDERLGGGRYRTGDLARLAGGEIALVGRLGDLIHVRGSKVSPLEVETVISALPAVDDVVVQGVRDPQGGGELVRAVVAARRGVTAEEVVRWCRGRLADFKVPRRVVVLPEIPRTARGKLDVEGLAAALAGSGEGPAAGPEEA